MTGRTFDRWIPLFPSSLALGRFRKDFTSLNDYYWGTAASDSAVSGKLRHLSDADDFRAELGLRASRFTQPLGSTTSEFQRKVVKSQAWHRRSVLVMLTSALERYLATVTSIAVASNPTLSRTPRLLDGIALLKHGVLPSGPELEKVTKGEWSKRQSTFATLFGSNSTMQTALSDLERMRKDRNAIAHSFGANLAVSNLSPHSLILLGASKSTKVHGEVAISEDRLIKLFGVVHSLAESIDKQLLHDHIGSYETAALYLEWNLDPRAVELACGMKPTNHGDPIRRRAKQFLTFTMGQGVTEDYVRSVDEYIQAL